MSLEVVCCCDKMRETSFGFTVAHHDREITPAGVWAAGSSASTVGRKREVSTVFNSLLLFRLPAQTMASPTEDVSSYLN